MLQKIRSAWSTAPWNEKDGLHGTRLLDDDENALGSSSESGSPLIPLVSGLSSRVQGYADGVSLESIRPAWLKKSQGRKLYATSYLDGLRGLAAFFVFIHHSSLALFPGIRLGYGAAPAEGAVNPNYIIQLPFLRLVFSGSAMVDIFFVISGAVLSLKPLRLARERKHVELIENLSSAAFRRGPRLYIPCMVSTFVTALASILGLMLRSGITRHYPLSASGSWTEQFWAWFTQMVQFVSPHAHGTIFEQNLWTIPIEFRGSLMVFLCALGVATLRSNWVRTVSLALLDFYWFYMGYWEFFLFLSGMLISEVSLYRPTDIPRPPTIIRRLYLALVIFAAYLLSMPEKGENLAGSSFGYGWMHTQFSPGSWANNLEPGRFWPCFGAVLLVAVFSQSGPDSIYQRFLTRRFIQYLGDISFSFYLWHGLVIFTVGARVMTAMLGWVGGERVGWWVSFIVTEMAVLPTLLWISNLSTIYVDRAAVNLGKKLVEL